MVCPVPYVASSGQNNPRSVNDGITFSIPVIAICVFGNEAQSLALPSFSVIAMLPVSAMIKFAPVIPISA
jgi:hypothetical protein